jgi:precorrin-6B methylase 2
MHGASDETIEKLANLDWRDDETVVDVGGGDGSTLIRLLRRRPTLRGVVFDRGATAAEAERRIADAGLEDRLQVVSGSFFERVPDGDAHLLVNVLHDWDGERATEILRALGERLLLVEGIVAESAYEDAWFDLLMLVLMRGQERTELEWRTLLGGAGYRLSAVHDNCVMEAIRCR